MSNRFIVGFSGNPSSPSSTKRFVEGVTNELAERLNHQSATYDISDLGPSFVAARSITDLDDKALHVVERLLNADALVIGSPTYKGSYTGLFKHFFDLLDPSALRGKPVILTATGGGDRHSLMVEHQLRPLFAFFEAFVAPTAIYASARDFLEGKPSEAISSRTRNALDEAALIIRAQNIHYSVAAE